MLQPKVMSKLEKLHVTKRCPVICLYKHNAYVWETKGSKAKNSNETCIHAKKTTSFVEPIMNVRLVLVIFLGVLCHSFTSGQSSDYSPFKSTIGNFVNQINCDCYIK